MLQDEQELLRCDSKYKRYAGDMEKALKTFEYTNEWADLITALIKVCKVIVSNKKYRIVPHRTLLSKRLAQCLHQSLPAGVHLKALEAYDTVLSTLSHEILVLDYPIYSMGLLPLLSHAALSVRPLLLKLYEERFLPLGSVLTPALTGLVLGFLPGLEEGSEFVDWTSKLLEKLSESVGVSNYYTCLWSCLMFNSSVRLVGTQYILSHVDRKKSLEDQLYVLGDRPSLLVQSIQTCLQDSSILVQRNTLDILNTAFSFHSSTLSRSDQIELLDSTLLVLLRRDMSLNKRVYNWLLGLTVSGSPMISVPAATRSRKDSGSSSASEPELEYFFAYSKSCVVESLRHLLSDSDPAILDQTKPLRIIISLLDRPEIGSAILEDIMIEILRLLSTQIHMEPNRKSLPNSITRKITESLYSGTLDLRDEYTAPQKLKTPLMEKVRTETEKTCHLLFGVLEPNFLWEYLADIYERVLWPSTLRTDNITMFEYCQLTNMLLNLYALESCTEIQTVYLPRLLNNILKLTKDISNDLHLSSEALTAVIELCRVIISCSLPRTPNKTHCDTDSISHNTSFNQIIEYVTVQDSQLHTAFIISHLLTTAYQVDSQLFSSACLLLIEISSFPTFSLPDQPYTPTQSDASSKPSSDWLNLLIKCAIDQSDSSCSLIAVSALLDLLSLSSLADESCNRQQSPNDDEERVSVILKPVLSGYMRETVKDQLPVFTAILWGMINDKPENTQCVESVYTLTQLLIQADLYKINISSVIISHLTHRDTDNKIESLLKFGMFWKYLRDIDCKINLDSVIMVVLSYLNDDCERVKQTVINWLEESLKSETILRVVEPCLIELLQPDTSRISLQTLHGDRLVDNRLGTDVLTDTELKLSEKITSTNDRIHSIGSDGKVTLRDKILALTDSNTSHSNKRVLVSSSGSVTANNLVTDPKSVTLTVSRSAGLAQNPFSSIGEELDDMIYQGFTPHLQLNSKWRDNNKTDDYNSIMNRARRINKNICEEEGIDFTQSPHDSDIKQDTTQTDEQCEVTTGAIPLPNQTPGRQKSVEQFNEALPTAPPPLDEFIYESSDSDTVSLPRSVEPSAFSSRDIVVQIIEELIVKVIPDDEDADVCTDENSSRSESSAEREHTITPDRRYEPHKSSPEQADSLYNTNKFILVYEQIYDSDRVVFSLNTIKSILSSCTRSFVTSLTNTTCDHSLRPADHDNLITLLARHVCCSSGANFYAPPTLQCMNSLRNVRLLEVLILITMYLWRSYYPHQEEVSSELILINSDIQLRSADLLNSIITQLNAQTDKHPRGFPQYMYDMLVKCKLQKTCLYYLQSVHDQISNNNNNLQILGVASSCTHSDLIIHYRSILNLISNVIKLEINLQKSQHDFTLETEGVSSNILLKRYMWMNESFISTLNLSLGSNIHSIHHLWFICISDIIPYIISDSYCTQILQGITKNTCSLIQRIAKHLNDSRLPADYIKQLLEDFTAFFHFCLINGTSARTGPSCKDSQKSTNVSTGQIFSNLVNVFNPLSNQSQSAANSSNQDSSSNRHVKSFQILVSSLPVVISSISKLWSSLNQAEHNCQLKINVNKLKQLISEFLSPLLHNYSQHFIGALAVISTDSQESGCGIETEETLINLLISIKTLPTDTLINKLNYVLCKPPSTDHIHNSKDNANMHSVLQRACLRLLKGYLLSMKSINNNSAHSFIDLFKSCLPLSLPANDLLLLFEILAIFVNKYGCSDDRKTQKDIQEILTKILESCCTIISSQLESSSWGIRKSYSVKVKSNVEASLNLSDQTGISVTDSGSLSVEEHDLDITANALQLMAVHTSALLDIVYPSEDKDKITPILTNLLSRVFPYLKNHSLLNMRCFKAGSQLLSSISSYQYSRKTWRREVNDLFLSDQFFMMDVDSLQCWKILIDTLLSHEKTLFKDLLARFTITSNSIQLFSSREGEFEIRANNLRKITFMILTGDLDRYKLYIPEIQERLADSLRLTSATVVMCQVFLTLRVLLLKMSNRTLLSMWSTINSELLLVLRQIENELLISEYDELQMSRVLEYDTSTSLTETNQQSMQLWLKLYLSACKFLDLMLALPSSHLPELQHYVWMYVGSEQDIQSHSTVQTDNSCSFNAHIPYIISLMNKKYGVCETANQDEYSLLLHQNDISSLQELHPFFIKLLLRRNTPVDSHRLIEQALNVIDNDILDQLTC